MVEELGAEVKYLLQSSNILVWSLFSSSSSLFASYGCEGDSRTASPKGRGFLPYPRHLLLSRRSEKLGVNLVGVWVAKPGR